MGQFYTPVLALNINKFIKQKLIENVDIFPILSQYTLSCLCWGPSRSNQTQGGRIIQTVSSRSDKLCDSGDGIGNENELLIYIKMLAHIEVHFGQSWESLKCEMPIYS